MLEVSTPFTLNSIVWQSDVGHGHTQGRSLAQSGVPFVLIGGDIGRTDLVGGRSVVISEGTPSLGHIPV